MEKVNRCLYENYQSKKFAKTLKRFAKALEKIEKTCKKLTEACKKSKKASKKIVKACFKFIKACIQVNCVRMKFGESEISMDWIVPNGYTKCITILG